MIKTLIGAFVYKDNAKFAIKDFHNYGLLFDQIIMLSRDGAPNHLEYAPGLGNIYINGNFDLSDDPCDIQQQLTDLGIPQPSGQRYEEELRSGKTVIAARGEVKSVHEAAKILVIHSADAVNIY